MYTRSQSLADHISGIAIDLIYTISDLEYWMLGNPVEGGLDDETPQSILKELQGISRTAHEEVDALLKKVVAFEKCVFSDLNKAAKRITVLQKAAEKEKKKRKREQEKAKKGKKVI